MGNLFGKKQQDPEPARKRGARPPPSEVSPQDKAILELKVQRDKLKMYQKKLGAVIERETQIARALLNKGDKPRALIALRKKKYQEGLLTKTDDMLVNLFEMVTTLEFTVVENDVLDGLKSGNEVLQQLHSEMSLDDVESLMSETEDAAYIQEQINEMLGGKLSEEDEDAVSSELAALEEEVLGEELESAPAVPTNPVPTTPVTEEAESVEGDGEVEAVEKKGVPKEEKEAVPA